MIHRSGHIQVTFEAKAKWFLEKNNLTVQEWNKFYVELIVLFVHTKIAIMFDHSRLGLENK